MYEDERNNYILFYLYTHIRTRARIHTHTHTKQNYFSLPHSSETYFNKSVRFSNSVLL